jgi:hypothetical protein
MLSTTRNTSVTGVTPDNLTRRDPMAHAAPGSSAEPPPADLPGRDAVTARDRLDAERWSDEGGSFDRESVTG